LHSQHQHTFNFISFTAIKFKISGDYCISLHIFSSGLGTGKGSVKPQNYYYKTLKSKHSAEHTGHDRSKANSYTLTHKIDMGEQANCKILNVKYQVVVLRT
jgi:hypothetical protein